MHNDVMEFVRFSAPDADLLARDIEAARISLEQARIAGDMLAVIDHAADLGSMLTTNRQEVEALQVLQQHLNAAEVQSAHEPAGWFYNAYATALQYAGQRDEADMLFAKALDLSRAAGWLRLQSFILHHWGRCLAEQRCFTEAEARLSEALALRVQLDEPLQASSRRALAVLAEWRKLDPMALPSD